MITNDDVKNLAELARIDIPEGEIENLRKDMEGVLAYVSEIQKVAGDKGEKEVLEHRNVFREDGEPHEKGLYTKGVLENAPETEGDYIKVKKIL